MSKTILAVWTVACLFLAGAQVARADLVENYDFSGTLANEIGGSTSLTGTFTVDFTTSSITQFFFASPTGTIDQTNTLGGLAVYTPAMAPNADFVQVVFEDKTTGGSESDLSLLFETNLASFENGTSALYTGPTVENFSGGATGSFVSCNPLGLNSCVPGESGFASGAASLAGSAIGAPEPSSFALVGAALAALAVARRRRRAA